MKRLLTLSLLGTAAYLALRPKSDFRWAGQVVLITGGSRGLGLVLARQLAQQGAKLALLARDEGELREAARELTAKGSEVLTLVADVTAQAEMTDAVRQVVERFGRLDVLINDAGYIVVGPLESMTLDDYERAMNVNFYGPLHGMLAVRDTMKAQGGGRIVNISSIGGKVAVPHLLPYSASKFALTGLSQGWRAELLKDGIVVTTAYPNLIRTGSPRQVDVKGRHFEEYEWFALSDNLPGLSQSAEDAAREILNAAQKGQAEIVTGLPAKLLAGLHAVFPGGVTNLASLANRLLPARGGIGPLRRKGYESETELTENFGPKRQAELAHNEG